MVIAILLIVLVFVDYEKNGVKSFYSSVVLNTKESKVLDFIQDMNPELTRKINNIQKEILISHKKINELYELRELHPNQKEIIDKALMQWNKLNENLTSTYQTIYSRVEETYVIFKINEIEGHESFKNESKRLLEQANEALENAKIVKSQIERSLYNE